MTKYQPHVYTIRTLTNLHVGGSGSNFDIVDKQVQRDPTTDYPSIHASSLKGALRDHFVDQLGETAIITDIFGSEPGDGDAKQGLYRFLSADILALPKPAQPFDYVSTKNVLEPFKDKIKLMGTKLPNDFPPKDWKKLSKSFAELTEALPVIARNILENGISQNLWYEEVVPRESIFGFVVLAPEKDQHFDKFNQLVNGQIIQIGANATIGYGLCKFEKIS